MSKIFTIFLSLIISSHAFSDVILKPVKSGETKVLVLIPGAAVKAEQYEDLAKQIQNTFPESLWVLIPSFLANFPNPIQIESKIKNIINRVQELGEPIK